MGEVENSHGGVGGVALPVVGNRARHKEAQPWSVTSHRVSQVARLTTRLPASITVDAPLQVFETVDVLAERRHIGCVASDARQRKTVRFSGYATEV